MTEAVDGPATEGRNLWSLDGRWLDPAGARLRGVVIPTSDSFLRVDLYDTQLDLLIEAKADSTRESVRYAIGQLMDYRRYLDPRPSLALLVPNEPSEEMTALLAEAGVMSIWRLDDGFTQSEGAHHLHPAEV